MTTRLILICHAATTATRAARFPDDEPLDGRAQTDAAADGLRRLDEVRCGPEIRCRETAAALNLEPTIDPALTDLRVGSWRGRTLSELERAEPAALHAWLTDLNAVPHGGESLHDLLDRVGGWLDALRASGRIAAITHPAVIRATVVHALGAPAESFWRIDVPPLSHTRLSGNGHWWTLRETGHPLIGSKEQDR
jgi:broad specificity phosphatase PhoE